MGFCRISQLVGNLILSFHISLFCFMLGPPWIITPDIMILTSRLSLCIVSFLQTHAHSVLVYLVSCLGSMEHSFHHTLLLEIRALTDRYPSLLGGCGKDIYRMSNSFTAIARLLGRRLEESTAMHCRLGDTHLQAMFSSSCVFFPSCLWKMDGWMDIKCKVLKFRGAGTHSFFFYLWTLSKPLQP